ncbi:hypothetical protein SAPIO_CDS1658 [Scedosporium apiospermum]|uniref:Uncharacterized protein n=1 Tax=Pseudallescheria apiosperma TaxID=563466 RepID=A0A084GES5_PSEDA|nr:uncharacterized protein SAPIO_CDS1658 [Scedosporium apiospermum]KEZ45837.1 hypothetical protein SAPIO_CDS1658 [Scedosporium apiospermum]
MHPFVALASIALLGSGIFAQDEATNTTLSEEAIESAPIISVSNVTTGIVVVDESGGNSSAALLARDLNALLRRIECPGGAFATPVIASPNVQALAQRVCDIFFPPNTVSFVPLPLPGGPIKVQAQLPGNLKVDFQYETRSCQNATNVFTPVRNTDCSDRFNAIIAFAASSANLNCPGGGFVHAGTDCDEATRPICFTFTLVETAIKCGTAVIEVYNSVDGLPNAHKTVEREADGIADVVGHLRDHQAQLQSPGFDSEIRNLTSRIVGQCDELRRILDECRPRKRGNVFSAGRATLKSLDEFDDSGVNESHGQLVDKLLQWTENSNGNVKLCVSSRVQEPFVGRFDSNQRIALHRLTERDIERFIRDRLEEHRAFRKRKEQGDSEGEGLVQDILRAAEGVFLWVALVLKSLERGLNALIPIPHLRAQVARTPSDLQALLTQILDSIDDGYRGSVDILLATILRSYGILLSPEGRDPGHAAFDTFWSDNVDSAGPRNEEFYLMPFGCFSILAAGDARKQISAQLGIADLEFHKWFPDINMSDDEVPKTIEIAVLSRCNGLIEVTDESAVKFIHRSIPEVLEEYLKRQAAPPRQLDDHQITLAMAWAYRMDVQWEAAMNSTPAQSSPLISRILSVVNGVSGIDNGANGVHNGFNELEHDELHFISFSDASSFLRGFLHRLRQMRFEDRSEEIFRILLSIDQTQYETCGFGRIGIQGDPTREQPLCLLDLSVFVGYEEFIDWAFRGRRVSDLETRLFLIMSRAIKRETEPNACLDVMKKIFRHGFPGSAVFPEGVHFAGKPLWHAVLMKTLRSAEPRASSKVLELWMRNGADPRVRFQLRKGLHMILMQGIMNSMTVAPAVAYLRGLKEGSIADEDLPQGMSLGTFFTLWKFPNSRALLDLIDSVIETDGSKKIDMMPEGPTDEKKAESEFGPAQNSGDISQQPLELAALLLANPVVMDVPSSTRRLRCWLFMVGIFRGV